MDASAPFVPNLAYLWVPFMVLHIIGQVGTAILLLTYFFSKNVHRPSTTVNFWITWLIYSISYSLLLYDKQQYTNPDTLCRVQAAMVDGSTSLLSITEDGYKPCLIVIIRVATAGFVAIVQIWLKMQGPQSAYNSTSTEKKSSRMQLVLYLCVPYVVFLAFSIGSALVGHKDFRLLDPMNGLYCSLDSNGFSRYGIPAYCAAIMLALLGFEVAILVKYWKTRTQTLKAFTLLKRDGSLSLILRVSLFSLGSVMVLSVGIVYMLNCSASWPHMIQASLPLLAVCIFGTQRDILVVWACWRDRSRPRPQLRPQLEHLQTSDISISSVHSTRQQIVSAGGSRFRFESAPSSAVEGTAMETV